MLNCDKCGLYLGGQSSIRVTKSCKETKREDYESLDETYKMENKYVICSGYESRYDSESIRLTGNFSTETELREKHPWITDIGEDVDNLCDDCITKMLIDREAVGETNDILTSPFYTSCCDKLFEDVSDYKIFYDVTIVDLFPYLSYFKIINWKVYGNIDPPSIYIKEEDAFFSFSPSLQCVICEDCLNKNRDKINSDTTMIKVIEQQYFPYQYTLENLRSNCETYIDFPNRGKELTLTSHDNRYPRDIRKYRINYYYYKSKKNNLLLKKELSFFIAKRNLYLLRKYFPISNDVISCILRYF